MIDLKEHGIGVGGTKINALLAEYVIAAGENISAGDLVNFINNQAKKDLYSLNINLPVTFEKADAYISAVLLDSNKILVAYQGGANSHGRAVILTLSGTIITVGTPVEFYTSSSVYYISVAKLLNDKVVVTYSDSSFYGVAVVLTISGTTIAVGSPVSFNSRRTGYKSATALDSNKVLVVYSDNDNSYYGTAVVLTISGTTITKGTATVFESANTNYLFSAITLSSNKVLVAYTNGGNGCYGTAVVLTISGTTITKGTATVFESASTQHISAMLLASNQVLVVYTDGGNSGYGTAVILSISDTIITPGTPIVFKSAVINYISTCPLNSSKALVAYRDNGNNYYGTATILVISDNSITIGNSVVFENATANFISSVMVENDKVLVVYSDANNSNYGTAEVLIGGKTAQGLAIQNGNAGETKKFYDWR